MCTVATHSFILSDCSSFIKSGLVYYIVNEYLEDKLTFCIPSTNLYKSYGSRSAYRASKTTMVSMHYDLCDITL